MTAKEEAISDKMMLSSGLLPTRRGRTSHSSGQDRVTKSYKSLKYGPLRFTRTFAGQGARLKLSLRSLTGDKYEMEAQATWSSRPRVPAGEWLYTVKAMQVPYMNFLSSVSVCEVASPSRPSRPGG